MARSRLTPDQAARRAQVVELRRQRMTFDQIGQHLGISLQAAHQLYSKAMLDLRLHRVDEETLAEEVELIDRAVNRLLDIAEDDAVSARSRIEAWNSIRGWAERKARLLGLDAPVKSEVVTLDAIDREIERLTAELGGREEAERAVAEAAPDGG